MKIGARLEAVASLVEKNSYCLDVGCDHALLDLYLTDKDKTIRTIASDNKEGPIESAKANIKKYHKEDIIRVKLGDGLSTYEDGINTVIIAGMGGKTVNGILKRDLKITKKIDTYIIQANNYVVDVRKNLINLGYYIDKEILVKDKKVIYQIIRFKKGKKKYSKKEIYFGPILLKNKTKLFEEYYKKEVLSREILLQLLPKNYYLKKWQVKREVEKIKKILEN